MIISTVDWLFEKINDSRVKIIAVILGTYVIFRTPITQFLARFIADPILSKTTSSTAEDILAISIVLISFIFFIKKVGDYTPSINFVAAQLAISIIYLYERLAGHLWSFTNFSFSSVIKYADLLPLITALNIILLFRNKKAESKANNAGFQAEQPIRNPNEDVLGFKIYVNQITGKIQESHLPNAFAIGINGAWGSGKTSFLYLVQYNLRPEKNLITVDFNSWNSLSPESIVKDFFDTLQEKIRPFHSTIPRMMKTYANKLVELNKNPVSQSIQAFVSAVTGFDSTRAMLEEINTALKQIDKKIIVYLDDLDRLNKDEIFQVLRLIRSTANFYNTFFIVTYDRNYVVHALNKNDIFNSEEFLEKIFQLEITLPYYNRNILRSNLFEKLQNTLPDKMHEELRVIVLGTQQTRAIELEDWVDNIRDVNRFVNTFSLNIIRIYGEVDMTDLFKLELLRFKYPSVYYLLFTGTSKFFEGKQSQRNEPVFTLRYAVNPANGQSTRELVLSQFLQENNREQSIPKNDIEKIVRYISSIFSLDGILPAINRTRLSVVYPDHFNKYFAYGLWESNLSEKEFEIARNLSQEEFNNILLLWCEKGLTWNLIKRFKAIDKFKENDDFEKVIRAMFYLGTIAFSGDGYPLWYDFNSLEDKLANVKKIGDNLYKNHDGVQGYQRFVRTLFEAAKPPFSFESELISSITNDHADYLEFPLTNTELFAISFGYFKNYLESLSAFDNHIFPLFWRTREVTIKDDQYGNRTKLEQIPDSTILLLKSLVNKDKAGFITRILNPDRPGNNLFSMNRIPITLYKRWPEFEEEFVAKLDPAKPMEAEFIHFYEEVKSKQFQDAAEFKFQVN